jgi:hypothetical protein
MYLSGYERSYGGILTPHTLWNTYYNFVALSLFEDNVQGKQIFHNFAPPMHFYL